ncbi:hypothetical protein V1499_03295 [Neobacillus sp. SCS-31]|uniref:hypothetical protein n=1 Tax=Neobacillus oceani TaxID=3115292 RepID=UPI0039065BC7
MKNKALEGNEKYIKYYNSLGYGKLKSKGRTSKENAGKHRAEQELRNIVIKPVLSVINE